MEGIEIPPFFTCPISLQIMRDPVTMCTGITYDRESMERWVFSYKKKVCPVTKQPLADSTMTPNHTLRRLIQQWCTENAFRGIERIPTPKAPIDTETILSHLQNLQNQSHEALLTALLKLKALVSESDRNKNCVQSAGTAKRLAVLIQTLERDGGDSNDADESLVVQEAMSLLHVIGITSEELNDLSARGVDLVGTLAWVLIKGDCQSRAHACSVLRTVFEGTHPMFLMSLRGEVLEGTVRILRDQISHQSTKCAVQVLMEVCKWGRNRIRVTKCGAISVLVDLIIESSDRKISEMLICLLDMLCSCAEGRAALLEHAAGIAAVSRKIMRVSQVTNDRAIRILHSLCKKSPNPGLVQEMLQFGAVSKLCLVIQVEGNAKTKGKAKEILKMHANVWRNSPCIPHHLLSSYPSK